MTFLLAFCAAGVKENGNDCKPEIYLSDIGDVNAIAGNLIKSVRLIIVVNA